MKQSIFRAGVLATIGLLMAGCAHFNVTEAIWFNPSYAAMAPKAIDQLSADTGYTVAYKSFNGADGTTLYGLLLTRPGNEVTILKFGGDSFATGYYGLEQGKLFESFGLNVFLVDYRGYGMSEGEEFALDSARSDALAAYDFLRAEATVNGTAIVVHGFSLGSFIAPYVANHRPVDGLILESTATDATDWAHNRIPWFAKPFVRIDIAPSLQNVSNVDALQRYHGPLLLLAGDKDRITPARFSQELHEKSVTPKDRKILYIAKDQRHGTVLDDAAARQQYMKFLDEVVSGG